MSVYLFEGREVDVGDKAFIDKGGEQPLDKSGMAKEVAVTTVVFTGHRSKHRG